MAENKSFGQGPSLPAKVWVCWGDWSPHRPYVLDIVLQVAVGAGTTVCQWQLRVVGLSCWGARGARPVGLAGRHEGASEEGVEHAPLVAEEGATEVGRIQRHVLRDTPVELLSVRALSPNPRVPYRRYAGGGTAQDDDPSHDGKDGSSFVSPTGETFIEPLKGIMLFCLILPC